MKNQFLCMVAMLTLLCASPSMAQKKVADDYLVGVWIMQSMQFTGEEKYECGKDYSQIKVYRKNGEYACAELAKLKDGSIQVLPHEYGTYSLKNGLYTEMGRKGNDKSLIVIDKNNFHSWWFKRHDYWQRSPNMPAKLVNYIVERCKANQSAPQDMQNLMRKHIFYK